LNRDLGGGRLQNRMKIDQLRRRKKLGSDKSEPLERQAEGTHPTAKSRWGHHLFFLAFRVVLVAISAATAPAGKRPQKTTNGHRNGSEW
jgi:hypothetical protein